MNYLYGMDELMAMAGVESVEELKGVTVSYHTRKYGIIDRDTMEVVDR